MIFMETSYVLCNLIYKGEKGKLPLPDLVQYFIVIEPLQLIKLISFLGRCLLKYIYILTCYV